MDDPNPLMHVDWLRWFQQLSNIVSAPVFISDSQISGGQPLTSVDDTNVTLSLSGTPATALLKAVSITAGWTGTLAAGRLNANVVQGVTNDTNVTGVIAAQNLTLGWTGTLAALRLNANVVQAVVGDANVTGSIAAQTLTLAFTGQLNAGRVATPMPILDSDNGNDALWAMAAAGSAVPVTGPRGLQGTSGMDGRDAESGDDPWASAAAQAMPWSVFTLGSVIFAGASGMLAQDNANLFWDATNHRLGIGTTSPDEQLQVSGANGADIIAHVGQTSVQTAGANVISVGQPAAFPNIGGNGFFIRSASTVASSGPQSDFVASFRKNDNSGGYVGGQFFFGKNSGANTVVFGIRTEDGTGTGTLVDRLRCNGIGSFGIGNGMTSPTAVLHLAAGTATASTAPFKFTSGTNLTTAEAGAMEYNGTNLFFTRAGTVRENVLVAIDNVAAPTTAAGTPTTRYGGNTNYLGDPNRWLSVNVLGSTYKIPLYT